MMRISSAVVIFCLIGFSLAEDCSNFNGEMGCKGGKVTTNPEEWAKRSFQTFLPGDPYYKPEYQSLGRLMCYPGLRYASDKKSATVEVICRKHDSVNAVQVSFDGGAFQSDLKFKADTSFAKTLTIKAQSDDGKWSIDLEPVDFLWNNAEIHQDAAFQNGQKGAIVELFGWPYEDIKAECPELAKMGWMAVKVFPPQESLFSLEWPQKGELNPWWFYYQPVSYHLNGRHGNREQLRDMVQACRKVGVRVYADAVVNHMSGGGNDVWPSHRNGGGNWCTHWGPKESTGSSPFFTHNFMYQNSNNTGLRPGMEYPGVPYIPTDFHCERSLNSWTDPFLLNCGWLSGLADLDTESPYVQQRIADYFTDLLSVGFSGFRIDAAKHIQPPDLAAIFKRFKDNLGGGDLPEDFTTYLEVIIGGEKGLLMCDDNYYNYGAPFAQKLSAAGLSDSDVNKIKIWQSAYPKEFPICGRWVIPSERLVAENDCHDDQNPGSSSRDMGDKGSVLIKEKNVGKHRGFEQQLFTRRDGNWQIKLVLSSYTFMNNGAQGIPDGFSDCAKCVGPHCNSCSKSMKYSKAHDSNVCGYTCEENGSWKEGVYTRVHRDYDIIQAMRDWQGLPKVTNPTDLGLPSHCGHASTNEFLSE